jgi:pyroglutamyl-peptidase
VVRAGWQRIDNAAMASDCLLLTGFEPFDGETVNVSWQVAAALHGRQVGGLQVMAVELPCVFGAALESLYTELRRWRPAMVLAMGQAAGRAELSFERVAINVDDARIADNAGASPIDTPVIRRAPAAYFSTLPIKAMAAAAQAAGLPAGISASAGTFVCNHVFFGLQHRLRRSPVRSGFLHLPLLPAQVADAAGLPALPLEDQVRGTRAALEAAVRHGAAPDVVYAAGHVA